MTKMTWMDTTTGEYIIVKALSKEECVAEFNSKVPADERWIWIEIPSTGKAE